jgi:poly [ADP-ribose] polymerase 1
VGTTIGGNKLTDYNKKEHALEEFKEVYLKQTGNEWQYRKTSTKRPNKFYPLEMDYGDEVFFLFCILYII